MRDVKYIDFDEQNKIDCENYKVGDKVRVLNDNVCEDTHKLIRSKGNVMVVFKKYKPFLHLRNEDWEDELKKTFTYHILKITPNGVEKINNYKIKNRLNSSLN